jgi:NAD-dependent DNA ligase
MHLDFDGQPHPSYNFQARVDRAMHDMLGMCRMALADGEVTEAEAQLLAEWIAANGEVIETWPGDILYKRLYSIFDDGKVSRDERDDLADLLRKMVGGDASVMVGVNAATTLPLDDPAPTLAFTGQEFVFTGKFAFGPRKDCQGAVLDMGATCAAAITKATRYLVIGTFSSRDWKHTSFGRKIQKAVDYRACGTPIAIVGEDHWAHSLP